MYWTRYQQWVVYSLRVTSSEHENHFYRGSGGGCVLNEVKDKRVSLHWMHWTSYCIKPVSFERACSLDDEIHIDRSFCWLKPCFCQFQSRRKRARAYSISRPRAGDGCQDAAKASVWCVAAVLRWEGDTFKCGLADCTKLSNMEIYDNQNMPHISILL